MSDRTMQAYIWASKLHPQAVPLLHLNKGDKFTFPKETRAGGVKVYRGRGWYSYLDCEKRFRTKTTVAVVPVYTREDAVKVMKVWHPDASKEPELAFWAVNESAAKVLCDLFSNDEGPRSEQYHLTYERVNNESDV